MMSTTSRSPAGSHDDFCSERLCNRRCSIARSLSLTVNGLSLREPTNVSAGASNPSLKRAGFYGSAGVKVRQQISLCVELALSPPRNPAAAHRRREATWSRRERKSATAPASQSSALLFVRAGSAAPVTIDVRAAICLGVAVGEEADVVALNPDRGEICGGWPRNVSRRRRIVRHRHHAGIAICEVSSRFYSSSLVRGLHVDFEMDVRIASRIAAVLGEEIVVKAALPTELVTPTARR